MTGLPCYHDSVIMLSRQGYHVIKTGLSCYHDGVIMIMLSCYHARIIIYHDRVNMLA
jgi:hypothetical protein